MRNAGPGSPLSVKSQDKRNKDTRESEKEPKRGSIINPVNASVKIDLGYLDTREYTDGLNEHHIDK
jgi:hypothetical protein